ncbi:MAG: glutathione synthase [Halioglobus sp.]|nr:glutathione synthase [Halioglobus sp.]
MPEPLSNDIIDDAVAQALQLDLSFLDGPGRARHVPFTFTPTRLPATDFEHMYRASLLLGTLTQRIARDHALIEAVHAPLAGADPFFARLLEAQRQLHGAGVPLREPLLLQRSDFMLDAALGPRLIECNSIAAGMGPFGQRIGALHSYLAARWPQEFEHWQAGPGNTAENGATAGMARAMAEAAQRIASELGDTGGLHVLVVVQEDEDNVFDQRLLENALRERGVRTSRRSFRQLHQQLDTGPNDALVLEDAGTVHLVYLRAGYRFADYVARDLDTRRCCDALQDTRTFIERHRVALNATVAQQLATSKRMQLHLAESGLEGFRALGFDADDAATLASVFSPMHRIDSGTATRLRDTGDTGNWVLKNQGEGGGHCLFDDDILNTLEMLREEDFDAWTLMQRLRPRGRDNRALLVRNGRGSVVDRLVSEIGLFTAHLGEQALPAADDSGYIGYLVRSKPPNVTEGGVHSGYGALDSLTLY